MTKSRKRALLMIIFSPGLSWILAFLFAVLGFGDMRMLWILEDVSIKIIGFCFFIEGYDIKKKADEVPKGQCDEK